MSLSNISYCRYLTDPNAVWSTDHYRVRNIVRAIKGDQFKGYASLQIGKLVRRLDSNNPEIATEWFVDRVATETDFRDQKFFLCPIPDSQSTPTSTHTPRTLTLGQKLSERLPNLQIWDHLRFAKPMQRKIRDEELLFNNFICTEKIPSGYIILLDDVCTSGAHARAAQRRLVALGAKDMCAMSVTRTMLANDEEVFGYRSDEL